MTPEEYRLIIRVLQTEARCALNNGDTEAVILAMQAQKSASSATFPTKIETTSDGINWQQQAAQWQVRAEKAEERVNLLEIRLGNVNRYLTEQGTAAERKIAHAIDALGYDHLVAALEIKQEAPDYDPARKACPDCEGTAQQPLGETRFAVPCKACDGTGEI